MPIKHKYNKKVYPDELMTPVEMPLPPKPPSLLTKSPETEAQYQKKLLEWITPGIATYKAAHDRNMLLLFEVYGIDLSKGVDLSEAQPWAKLTLAMAMDFFPGFSLSSKKPSGCPKKWDDFKMAKIFVDVEREKNLREAKAIPADIKTICMSLSNRSSWKGVGTKMLMNKYHQARKSPLVSFLNDISKHPDIIESDYDIWEDFLSVYDQYNLPGNS